MKGLLPVVSLIIIVFSYVFMYFLIEIINKQAARKARIWTSMLHTRCDCRIIYLSIREPADLV
ncbi:hypothetical protein Q5741_11405 [Paenibacillus sp. JX-17]|uniref:Uncharacterized protein n=1 Tax=Paenibacillus lacisoli TaxID=3064525 RepID=A0ABT9CCM9_9BACL|nr:hypothetical protein [Paenibacillus sp. JX-17]MDO7907022.1 hypothetical protein [Paenibacillus sp. JX-17]